MTKLSSTLPGGDNNGLGALARALTADPHKTAIIVAVVDCKSITIDTDTGDKVATVRIRRVEPIDPQDTESAQRLLVRGLERRTGAVMLPMDMEDELTALFANLVDLVDLDTGEILDEAEDKADGEDGQEQLPEVEDVDGAPDEVAAAVDEVNEKLAADAAALGFTESAETFTPNKSLAEELDETIAKAEAEFKPKMPRKSRAKKPAETPPPVEEPAPVVDDDDGPPWPEH